MRQLVALALTFLAVPVVAQVARAGDVAVPTGAVAVVAGESVTRAQLDDQLATARRSYASYGARFPDRRSLAYRRIQDDAVRFLVDWAEVRQQAGALGVNVTSDEINERIAAIKDVYFHGSERLYRRELARQGLTAAQARANVRRQLVSQGIYVAVAGDADTGAEAAARWTDWLDALHARYAPLVAYAPGYEPR